MQENTTSFQVKSNGYEFTFTPADIASADLVIKSPTEFHLLNNSASVNAILLETDRTGKQVQLEIDGEIFDITIKDELDTMLDKMGFNTTSSRHIKEIKAPMPGMVLEINVMEGQEVKEGERLLILSAMKMENSILIHADGKIKKINIVAGQAVDKGQVLMELE